MLEYVLDGGLIMWPLLFLSFLSIAVIIDRWRAFRAADTDSHLLRERVSAHLDEGHLDEAISECENSSGGPVAAVLLAGLAKYRKLLLLGRHPTEAEVAVTKTMEDYAPSVLATLEKRLNLLTMIASVSPLLGMTGTVTGMIKSFNKMAESAGLDAGAVAGGISEALITTASGLLIAIPAVIAYNVFAKKIDNYTVQIDEVLQELVDFISLGHAGH
jgi:biopolymer transport protein ExbB/TolQ